MSKPYIELISNESGDWEILRVDFGEGFYTDGHSINRWDWIELLEILGYKVDCKEISDEDMEEGNY